MPHLLIPDVHEQAAKLRKILKEHGKRGRPVFLGDMFDSLQLGGMTEMLDCMEELLDLDALWCLGNHDAHYLYAAVSLRCTGYRIGKWSSLRERPRVFSRWKDRAKLYQEVEGWMVSHAGFHETVLSEVTEMASLPEVAEDALARADLYQGDHVLLSAGHARGGYHPVGGPMWLDWADFEPVEGMKQIVGHTTQIVPMWKGQNLCLDTGLKHVALVDGNEWEIIEC
jgi:hypothetical protein